MSDSESDGFRIANDSGSDDFLAPSKVVKKAAPAKKTAASSSKATKVCAQPRSWRSELILLGSCGQESSGQETTSGSQEECSE